MEARRSFLTCMASWLKVVDGHVGGDGDPITGVCGACDSCHERQREGRGRGREERGLGHLRAS